jgi:hypothetical protein
VPDPAISLSQHAATISLPDIVVLTRKIANQWIPFRQSLFGERRITREQSARVDLHKSPSGTFDNSLGALLARKPLRDLNGITKIQIPKCKSDDRAKP